MRFESRNTKNQNKNSHPHLKTQLPEPVPLFGVTFADCGHFGSEMGSFFGPGVANRFGIFEDHKSGANKALLRVRVDLWGLLHKKGEEFGALGSRNPQNGADSQITFTTGFWSEKMPLCRRRRIRMRCYRFDRTRIAVIRERRGRRSVVCARRPRKFRHRWADRGDVVINSSASWYLEGIDV